MFIHEVHTVGKAFAYLTDCTLATVSTLKMRKSSPRYETERQINLAQFGVDFCNEMLEYADYEKTRIKDVIEKFDASVKKWSEQFKP